MVSEQKTLKQIITEKCDKYLKNIPQSTLRYHAISHQMYVNEIMPESVREWLTQKRQANEQQIKTIRDSKTRRNSNWKIHNYLIERNIQIDELLEECKQP